MTETKYQAILAVIADGRTVADVAARRKSLFVFCAGASTPCKMRWGRNHTQAGTLLYKPAEGQNQAYGRAG